MNFDRMTPHNIDAEQHLLGGILRFPDSLQTLQGSLRAEDFYKDAHQTIYRAMILLQAARVPIDLVSLYEKIRAMGHIDNIGGPSYIADIYNSEPTGALYESHAVIVREKSTLRNIIHVAKEMIRDAFDEAQPADEQLADAERKILAIAEKSTPIHDAVKVAAEFLPAAANRVDERISSGGTLRGTPTGYQSIDEILGGLRPGDLGIVAARPSVGKTAFALNTLANVANGGSPVLLFSLEMPLDDIADRLLAMGSGVPIHRFTKASSITDEEAARIVAASGPSGLGGAPIYVDDTSDVTAARIAAVARRMVRRTGIELIAIDYLGLMRPENMKCSREEQVGTLSLRVKNLARELGIPILLLAQLNREVENRPDPKPKLSDLRDSGRIEQDADRVVFLWRQPNLPSDHEVWRTEVTIAKNRNGPIGDTAVNYRRPVMRFEDVQTW